MKPIILFILLLAFTACTQRYTGYVIDSDNGQPLDSVLLTTNFDTAHHIGRFAHAWHKEGIASDSQFACAYTDNTGFFTFDGAKRNDHTNIWFIRKGYEPRTSSQEYLHGDTIYLSPNWEIREAREKAKQPRMITLQRQLPLQLGETKFLVHEMSTYIYVTSDTIESDFTYTAIYFDTDKKSAYYDFFTNFNLGEYYYPEPATARRSIPAALPRRWIEIEEYQGDYYLYASFPRRHARYMITDTTLIIFGIIEGDFGFACESIGQVSAGHYVIKNIRRSGWAYCGELHIYIVDPARGIAVIENRKEGEETRRALYVDARKARNFPIIVHECDGDIMPDYYRLKSSADYDKLLKRFKP